MATAASTRRHDPADPSPSTEGIASGFSPRGAVIPSLGELPERAGKFIAWRARLEADGGGLENRYECKLIKGSNPLPSAALTYRMLSVRSGQRMCALNEP